VRTLILALAAAVLISGVASAQMSTGMSGPDIKSQIPPPAVSMGARDRAEAAVRHDLGGDGVVDFREVKASVVASIRHGPFAPPIDGPVSIVCGKYAAQDAGGGHGDYAWFFAAIKHGQVLWTADAASGAPDEAYASCKGAGLAG
jgi:hypothetical protein